MYIIFIFLHGRVFSHDELISHRGHYYDMWQQQLTKLEETDTGNGNGENNENGANGNSADMVVKAEVNGTT